MSQAVASWPLEQPTANIFKPLGNGQEGGTTWRGGQLPTGPDPDQADILGGIEIDQLAGKILLRTVDRGRLIGRGVWPSNRSTEIGTRNSLGPG